MKRTKNVISTAATFEIHWKKKPEQNEFYDILVHQPHLLNNEHTHSFIHSFKKSRLYISRIWSFAWMCLCEYEK